MTKSRTGFQTAFEAAAPSIVKTALDHTQGDPRVTELWVFATFEDSVSAYTAAYRVDGEVMPLTETGPLFGTPDATTSAIGDGVKEIFYGVDDAELPNSMLVHYVVKTAKLDAHFSDERLPRQAGEPYSEYVLRWAKEFNG